MSWLFRRWRMIASLLAIGLAMLALMMHFSGVQSDWLEMLRAMREQPKMLVTATLIYALCLAVPYVPGIELGIMLMIVFGRPGILMAWLGTVMGLSLAFLIGVFLRKHFVDLRWLGPWRKRAQHLKRDGSAQLESSRLGSWLQARLARFKHGYPYLLLAALFNLPGNWVLGGGGGIALASGLSGKLKWLAFVLTVAVATSAVPLLVWVGWIEIERWLPV